MAGYANCCLYPLPGGLSSWETCPDVCVKKWPEMRELRDPQNVCQIGQVPLYGYDVCKTPSIGVQVGLNQYDVVFNSYSNP